jgi:hypothetical protein
VHVSAPISRAGNAGCLARETYILSRVFNVEKTMPLQDKPLEGARDLVGVRRDLRKAIRLSFKTLKWETFPRGFGLLLLRLMLAEMLQAALEQKDQDDDERSSSV